jgi:hypothetical protein
MYGYGPAATPSIERSLHFVLTRSDYDQVFRLVETGPPADAYNALLQRLKLGSVSVVITGYHTQGNDYEWVEFRGQACVPTDATRPQ